MSEKNPSDKINARRMEIEKAEKEIRQKSKCRLKSVEEINYNDLMEIRDDILYKSIRTRDKKRAIYWEQSTGDKLKQHIMAIQKSEPDSIECFKEKDFCDEYACFWRGLCKEDYFAKLKFIEHLKELSLSFDSKSLKKIIKLFYTFDSSNSLYTFEFLNLKKISMEELLKFLLDKIISKAHTKYYIEDLSELKLKKDEASFIKQLNKIGEKKREKICEILDLNPAVLPLKQGNEFKRETIPIILSKINFDNKSTMAEEMNYKTTSKKPKTNTKIMNLNDIKEGSFDVPSKLIIYNGTATTELEKYHITVENGITDNKASLYNTAHPTEDCGKFDLKEIPGKKKSYFLTAKEGLVLEPKNGSSVYYLVVDEKEEGKVKRKIDIKFYDLETVENLELCIDFGTTNTTLGCFLREGYIDKMDKDHPLVYNGAIELGKKNYVHFKEAINWKKTVPTTLYTTEIKNDKPEFIFGYEANARAREENFVPKGSVIKNFKEWLKDLDTNIEDLSAPTGEKLKTYPKRAILKEYLLHIISVAETQFKCKFKKIHFSAPIERKEEYINGYKETLKGKYEVLCEEEAVKPLDEAVAGLYNIISNKMQDNKNYKEKILVIDIGGGTTDLASCKYEFTTDEDDLRDLKIEVDQIRGSDFGGNDITKRILEFMQIRFAFEVDTDIKKSIDELLDYDGDLFRKIDADNGIENIFKKFKVETEKAEAILPIRFERYKHSDEMYKKAKQNYFFLWERSEIIKKAFFSSNELIELKFGESDDELGHYENITEPSDIIPIKRENLKFMNKDLAPSLEISFSFREINRLISSDIYNVIRNIIKPLINNNVKHNEIVGLIENNENSEEILNYIAPLKNDGLRGYDTIKFVGQSSRIELFKTSLKEFLAGNRINRIDKKREVSVDELKLSCLDGAINRLKDKGEVHPEIILPEIKIPYEVSIMKEKDDSKKIMISAGASFDLEAKSINKLTNAGFVEILFTKQNSVSKKESSVKENFAITDFKIMNYAELANFEKKISQKDHLDELKPNRMGIFLIPKKKENGIRVVAIKKATETSSEQKFLVSKHKLIKFEDINKKLLEKED